MTLDRAQVDHLAELSALSLEDGEAEAITRDLRAILEYVTELASVDTSSVDTARGTVSPAVWRDDVTVPGLSHEEALAGAARTTATGFQVPAFVPVAGSSNDGRGAR